MLHRCPLAVLGALASSFAVSPASALQAAEPTLSGSATLGWWVFVGLLGAAVAGIPALAGALRRALPSRRAQPIRVAAAGAGASPRVRRSPRHAVSMHRALLTTVFLAWLAILLVPGVTALRTLGVPALQVGLACVLPTLLVTLHARRRGTGP